MNLVNAGTGNDQYTALQNADPGRQRASPTSRRSSTTRCGQFALGKSLDRPQPATAPRSLDGTYSPGPWNRCTSATASTACRWTPARWRCSTTRRSSTSTRSRCPPPGTSTSTAAREAAQGRPEGVHHQRHRRRRLHHQHDLAGRRQARTRSTAPRSRVDFARPGHQEVHRGLAEADRREAARARSARWSDEWYKGLGDGTIATLATGAWMPANFASGVAGRRRLARRAAAAVGGGRQGQRRERRQLAGRHEGRQEQGPRLRLHRSTPTTATACRPASSGGAFPATTADLNSAAFQNTEFPYFGGQKANKIFAESAADVAPAGRTCPTRSTPTRSSTTPSARPTSPTPRWPTACSAGRTPPSSTARTRASPSTSDPPAEPTQGGRSSHGRPPRLVPAPPHPSRSPSGALTDPYVVLRDVVNPSYGSPTQGRRVWL